jgi:Ca-activated chloride channel family protein
VAAEDAVTFGHPLLLLTLLVPVAAMVALAVLARRPARYPVRFTNLDVLALVAPARRSWRNRIAPALFLVALSALCVAVARPHAATTVVDDRATVVMAIDASRSMQSDDVKPTRLVAAERAAKRFLDRVPERLRVALVVFSGDVQVAAPPTRDRELVREAIDEIGSYSGFGGTAIGDAIARSVEVGRAATDGSPRGLVTIVFLSDGRQNRGVVQPLEGARRAKRAGIPVSTIALGTRNGGGGGGGLGGGPGGFGGGFGFGRMRAPDPATLRAIARVTGGRFFQARTAASLGEAYDKLGTKVARKPGRTEVTFAFVLGSAVLLVGSTLAAARWAPRLP